LRAARASFGDSDWRFRDVPPLPASLAAVSHSRMSADWGVCTRVSPDGAVVGSAVLAGHPLQEPAGLHLEEAAQLV
jgi:hypothetical protein